MILYILILSEIDGKGGKINLCIYVCVCVCVVYTHTYEINLISSVAFITILIFADEEIVVSRDEMTC